jgi:hypothetical protein
MRYIDNPVGNLSSYVWAFNEHVYLHLFLFL